MMLMAAAALASCEKQNTLNEPEAQKGTYTYTLSATAPDMIETDGAGNAQAPISKTDYNASGVFSWSAGDQISVLFHKDDDNKFFTFTTSGSGATADFTGTVDDGYTIGASDGDAMDKKIWALFPASANHSYTAGNNPTFYVQPSVDFTATHFSANIPMYDLLTEEGTLSFKNLACTYKFIVSGIKNGVSKVDFSITNGPGYRDLSGSSEIGIESTKYFVKYGWTGSGLNYTGSVTDNQAVFYVSCRYWGEFQPTITVTNHATGVAIKTFTATAAKQPNYLNHIWPITLDVSGGDYFEPVISINGNMSDWDPATNALLTVSNYASVTGNSKFKELKVAYDERNFYIYVKRNRVYSIWGSNQGYYYFFLDTDNDSSNGVAKDGANYDYGFFLYPFAGTKGDNEASAIPGFNPSPSTNLATGFTLGGGISTTCAGAYDETDVETEISFSRTSLGIDKNDVINIAGFGNKSADSTPYTKITGFTIIN